MCRWEGSPSRLGALALLWWAANTRLRPAFARRNLAFFGQCRPEAWRPAEGPENETGLTVLQATVGHSGTTSMSAALHLLGLRSFHSDDVLVYLPEMFFPRPDVAALLRSCRVEAVALQHWLELNFELIERRFLQQQHDRQSPHRQGCPFRVEDCVSGAA
ncbi:unnamed protein product [Prorocentrum cordatum]|uniref:Uncharacterized protein n=1 Tax=Prorocentrum cordatum TaxID=2364126 RepID=A0ABN9W3F0_9DINO|nr:unnamed protein product [Polarella glacialis]